MSDRKPVGASRGRGAAFYIAEPRDLPVGVDFVQWRVENQEEVARFLEPFMVRIKPIPGDQLLIQGAFTKMDLQLSPGDCLILHNDRLGVVRVPESEVYRSGDASDFTDKRKAGYIDPHLLN